MSRPMPTRDATTPAELRQLTPDDTDAYRTLRLLALAESPTAFGSSFEEEAAFTREFFERRLSADGPVAMYGAFVDGALVGMIGVGRETALKERHRAFIRSMYVHPDARRLGLGAALLSRALADVDAMPGVWQVTLTVTAGNAPAQRLYAAHGFTEFGRAPAALFVNGVYYDDVLMLRHRTTR
jgi:ribosomal protein S18 acetylase RimI-like enzyme